ncbi:MAG: ABC transporter ATP-binding protein [Ignisphaera sp.]
MQENELLVVDRVSKYYGYGLLGLKKFKAVDSVSLTLDLAMPSIFVLAGETGSGKTTLLRMILTMVKPDEGNILYRGYDIHKLRGNLVKWYRREVQPVFQDPYEAFNPLRRVDSYLYDIVIKFGIIRDRILIDEEVDKMLNYVGLSLDRVKGKYPYEFSGGELQRISIARALLARPRLLLADEPVSMIDVSLRVGILNLLRKVKEDFKTSIIYVTHDLSTAYYVGDRIGIMFRGVMVELGAIEKVYNEPLHPYTKQLLNSLLEPDPEIETRITPPKLTSLELKEFLTIGCKYSFRCPYKKSICVSQSPPTISVDFNRLVKCWLYAS